MIRIFLLVFTFTVFIFPLEATGSQEAPSPLRFGLVTAADALPAMLARDRGYFALEGVEVDLILFYNPQERDAAIQAGQLDGAISDLLAAFFFAAAGFDFRITSLTSGRFGLAGSPQSEISTLAGLQGRRVGFFPNTMTQYIADSLLGAAGVAMTDYEGVPVPNIRIRLEMLMNGLIDAAVLPEPLLTVAVSQGAALIASTDGTELVSGTFYFSRNVLENRLDEVKAFHRAYYRAVRAINADPDSFRDYLVERVGFPQAVRDSFEFFTFNKPELPTEQQLRRAHDWLRARRLLSAEISHPNLIDARPTADW